MKGLRLSLPWSDWRPRAQVEAEILEELHFHIEMRTQENVEAGMEPSEARRDAEERFGAVSEAFQECRKAQIGDRIMLQRINFAVMAFLLVAVVVQGWNSWDTQRETSDAVVKMQSDLQALNAVLVQELGIEGVTEEDLGPGVPIADADEQIRERLANLMEDTRRKLVCWELDFDSVFPGSRWRLHDPTLLEAYPSENAWPDVLGCLFTDPDEYRLVTGAGETAQVHKGAVAITEPLDSRMVTSSGATLMCLDGIGEQCNITAKNYTVVVCDGEMAGKLFLDSYATTIVNGDFTGRATSMSYANFLVEGEFTGNLVTKSYAMVYLLGGLGERAEIVSDGRIYIGGHTSREALSAIKGGARVYLEKSDLGGGSHRVDGKSVYVAEDS